MGNVGAVDVNAVLVLEAVFQHLKLQNADNADHHALHTATGLKEDLDRALLGDLLHAFGKLLALHGVLLLNDGKMLGRKGGDLVETQTLDGRIGNGVADREDAGVKHADDIPCVGGVHHLARLGHHLLGLGEAEGLAALRVEVFTASLKHTGGNTHKGNTVAVCLVHVGLDLENKCREMRIKRIDRGFARVTGKR